MLDFRTRFGRHVIRRLQRERIVWLTTVASDDDDSPLPRPVWFHWDGRTVLILSQKGKAKLRHISHNPRVALNFNTDSDGGDVAVIVGDAHILERRPRGRVTAYLKKYRRGIKDLDMTVEKFKNSFAVPIQVIPRTLQGFIE
ncbi:MAG TPA: TIGR03667 family PPOX class F420-dependent oxidoreductase [Candidatus Binatia bacterium]|jgi:PPOX class probable F420-dependent enzyme|nr:TIGR03667 family PPOX class F420-dependent oxidoreductase [Candidatus Binatia bacterium]